MKKKLSLVHSLALLPIIASTSLLSMEKQLTTSNNNSESLLAESVMITPVTTTRGLGFFRSTADVLWNEEENLYYDLANKKFDPSNSSYHRKLDTAIEIFVDKKNDQRLTETFDICRKEYAKQIKISDIAARKAHEFLVKENKDKQSSFAKAIETKDKQFIDKQNVLLDSLQKTIGEQIIKIDDLLKTHLEERNSLVKTEGEDIRRIKKALVQLHHLNKTFALPSDGYCSDEEKDAENVKNSYNDVHLLRKINVEYSMSNTKTKVERMLKMLYELNGSIQEIQQLHY